MIPLHLKTPDFSEPGEQLYYLAASNGIFLVRKTALFVSATKADPLPGLERQSECVTLLFPKVPAAILATIYGFFRAAYRRWQGEAVAFLFYAPETGRFRVGVPPQSICRYRNFLGWKTECRVRYEHCTRPKGYLKLGDAHSHANLPAFFSSTDDEDDQEDGLRIAFGHLNQPRPEICVSFVVGGVRFPLQPKDVLEDFTSPHAPPRRWLRRVTCHYECSTQHGRHSGNGRFFG